MRKTLLQLQYSRLLALYSKLDERLNRHFSLGRFHQFTIRQQNKLLNKLNRLKKQLVLLEKGLKLTTSAFALGAVLHSTEAKAQLTLLGAEFKANTSYVGPQTHSSVAIDDDGDYVITWKSGNNQDGSGFGIYAQRYNNLGAAQGGEFLVNSYTTGDQSSPAIAMNSVGDFVIAWASINQDKNDGTGIYAQRYSANGTIQGPEFLVNTYTTLSQNFPTIAMESNGDFVIVWESDGQDLSGNGIYGKRFDALGVGGAEFQISTFSANQQRYPSVAMDNDGDFAVSWISYGQEGSGSIYGIYARRYDNTGTVQGAEFLVNTTTTDNQFFPTTAMDTDGDFVVAWMSNVQTGDNSNGIYAQRFNASGTAVGTELHVNTYTTGVQTEPSVAMDDNGDFVVAWYSNLQDDGVYSGVYAQRYNAWGSKLGIEFKVNTQTTYTQRYPSAAMDNSGDFIISWESYQDGSSYGIYAQRYNGNFATAINEGNTEQLFNIYPNPAKDQVMITIEGEANVKIYDISGALIKEETLKNNILSTQGINTGIYFVEINQNGRKTTKKLAVE